MTIDERNTFFSRLGLVQDSEDYQHFYQTHPDYKSLDDAFRGEDFKHALKLPHNLKERVLSWIDQETSWLVKTHHEHMKLPINQIQKPLQTESIKRMLYALGAVDVMVVPLDKEDYYTHHGTVKEVLGLNLNNVPIEPRYSHAILFASQLDSQAMTQAPFVESLIENMTQYSRVASMAFDITKHLKQAGYDALAQHREYYEVPLVPLAHKHHFGAIGMANHIIHPTYGNLLRLNAVLTNAPLKTDTRPFFDVTRFCKRCALCLMNCPTQAIKPHPSPNSVMQKFDEHRCFIMFQKGGTDCSLCITSCPFSFALDDKTLNTLKTTEDIDVWLKAYLKQHGPKRRPFEASTYKEEPSHGHDL